MPLPDNGSGYGEGCYASPKDAEEYRKKMSGYLRRRNAAWLDRWTDRQGNIPDGVKELANEWRCDGHITKWAIQQGFLHQDSIKRDGLQHRQIGRLSAVVYNKSELHHRALAFELAGYLDGLERAQITLLHRKHPEFEDVYGRWVRPPADCAHDWEWLRDGGHRCRLCRGEWRPDRPVGRVTSKEL